MKLKLVYLWMALFSLSLQAQNESGKTDDFGRIAIVPYMVDQVENVPMVAQNNLSSKMAQILTKNGIAGSVGFHSQFIMVPNISVLSKQVVAGAPPKVALTMEVAFYIGDGVNGVKFGSTALTLKGVGTNEGKAYINAFKNIRTNNPELKQLIELAKNRILEYYNDGCDFIMKEADNLAVQNKYDQALYTLSSVPVVSKKCFNRAQDKIGVIYKKKINRDCDILLNQATNAWNTGQNYEAAAEAAEYLNQIEPESKCFSKVQALAKTIRGSIKDTTDKQWNLLVKQLESITEIEKARLTTSKEIAEAYANRPPDEVTYKVKEWW